MRKIKLKISKQSHLEVLYNFITYTQLTTGQKQVDNMVNSILHELSKKIDSKLENLPKKFDLTLKEYQSIALYTLYFDWSKNKLDYQKYETNVILNICNQIHPKLV